MGRLVRSATGADSASGSPISAQFFSLSYIFKFGENWPNLFCIGAITSGKSESGTFGFGRTLLLNNNFCGGSPKEEE